MSIKHRKLSLNNSKSRQCGFTLIELMIVMSIIGILVSIVVPNYQRHLIKAREAVLMEDLYQMRRAIDAYFADHISYPESLDDLVANKYIRDLPRDPFTQATDTWEEVPPVPSIEGDLAEGGLENVHSGSDLVGLNGIPYRDW
ncbi:MAG: prepilin-type N-terminal cleavage/methylation domain-containing protein [Desulfuromonadales bacterium]|nr:prepilin-type N-terminal cleavage/methylation domain-containing protein [Desulfuromonadales bacterium]